MDIECSGLVLPDASDWLAALILRALRNWLAEFRNRQG